MPNYRLPTCVDAARGKKKRRARTKANVESDGPCQSFRDRTLTWFRLGEELEDKTGEYVLPAPEQASSRATQIWIAVTAAAGLLIVLAYVVAS